MLRLVKEASAPFFFFFALYATIDDVATDFAAPALLFFVLSYFLTYPPMFPGGAFVTAFEAFVVTVVVACVFELVKHLFQESSYCSNLLSTQKRVNKKILGVVTLAVPSVFLFETVRRETMRATTISGAEPRVLRDDQSLPGDDARTAGSAQAAQDLPATRQRPRSRNERR